MLLTALETDQGDWQHPDRYVIDITLFSQVQMLCSDCDKVEPRTINWDNNDDIRISERKKLVEAVWR